MMHFAVIIYAGFSCSYFHETMSKALGYRLTVKPSVATVSHFSRDSVQLFKYEYLINDDSLRKNDPSISTIGKVVVSDLAPCSIGASRIEPLSSPACRKR